MTAFQNGSLAFAHPRCFARGLNNCASKITREHYFSDAIYRLLMGSQSLHVEGMPWLPAGEALEMAPSSLTSKLGSESNFPEMATKLNSDPSFHLLPLRLFLRLLGVIGCFEGTMRREFFLQDDQSNKFWTIEVVGTDVVSTNGRIGAKPRETRATYSSVEAAEAAAGKDVLGKRRKGYIEGNLANVPEYVDGLPPRFVRINHDDYHAKFVGKVHDGSQFFLTHPFAQSLGDRPGANFMALYIFDEFGLLTDARIEQLGEVTQSEVDEMTQRWLATLGKYRFADISVAPFCVEKFGREFGLIFDPEDEEELGSWVTVQPGDYMAFYPPWDGEYDT